MRLFTLILGFISLLNVASAQSIQGVINSYARVRAINQTTFTITIDNLEGSIADFDAGKKLLIIQMKGAAVNGTNTASFGNITNYNNAGNYEMSSIQFIQDMGGGSFELILDGLARSYNVGNPGGYVQVVSVPQYTNVLVNGTVTALPWDETKGVGGIVSFEVSNTLTLGANIDVSGQGFEGGQMNTVNNGGCTNSIVYATDAADGYAHKGQGVSAEITNLEFGRGNLANGGGGANTHNAGGGGGGNYTSGGAGGAGWPGAGACSGSVNNGGGLGGMALDYNPATNKVFMGGGGGGGQQNNSAAIDGGRGGGIVIVRTNILASNCTGTHQVLANGEAAADTPLNDGSSGGGAGGVILLEVKEYLLSCDINLQVNGGDGGNVNSGGRHGGGGGGGVGAVLLNSAPSMNVQISSMPGNAGQDCNQNNASCNPSGSDGDNPSNLISTGWGVSGNTLALPIELGSFSIKLNQHNRVTIQWITITEKNTSHFIIERTQDFKSIAAIARESAAGNSSFTKHYSSFDLLPKSGKYYYRLKTVDLDSSISYSKWVAVNYQSNELKISMYPNPAVDYLNLNLTNTSGEIIQVSIFNSLGKNVYQKRWESNNQLLIDVQSLHTGVYTLLIVYQQQKYYKRLVISH